MSAEKTAAAPRILYCRCAYARVVPDDVKDAVLRRLCASGEAFDAVPDLCDMAARSDPALATIAASAERPGGLAIAACFPRAVRWLFHGAKTPLREDGVTILNMREQSADDIVAKLLPAEAAR